MERGTGIRPNFNRLHQKIRTFDPSKLIEDDYVDFSLKSRPVLRIVLHPGRRSPDPQPPSGRLPDIPRLFQPGASWSSSMFPPDTRGFLYYHVPPNSSPLAGELRFRLTSSRNPASFASGTDLITERSLPWRFPLYRLMSRSGYHEIVSLLLQDGLVAQRTVDLVTAAVRGMAHSTGTGTSTSMLHLASLSATPALSAFGQEFDLKYSADFNFCGVFASRDAVLTHHMRYITSFRATVEGKEVHYCPFRGSVICRFERSTLPEHAGRRVVVMRVVRMVESDPIRRVPALLSGRNYPGIEVLRPRAGELLKIAYYRKMRQWAVDVDKEWSRESWQPSRMRALKVLFENEELYGSPQYS